MVIDMLRSARKDKLAKKGGKLEKKNTNDDKK